MIGFTMKSTSQIGNQTKVTNSDSWSEGKSLPELAVSLAEVLDKVPNNPLGGVVMPNASDAVKGAVDTLFNASIDRTVARLDGLAAAGFYDGVQLNITSDVSGKEQTYGPYTIRNKEDLQALAIVAAGQGHGKEVVRQLFDHIEKGTVDAGTQRPENGETSATINVTIDT